MTLTINGFISRTDTEIKKAKYNEIDLLFLFDHLIKYSYFV